MYQEGFLIIFFQKEENVSLIIDLFKGVLGSGIKTKRTPSALTISFPINLDFNYAELINMINYDMFIPSVMFFCPRLYDEITLEAYEAYIMSLRNDILSLNELAVTEEKLITINKWNALIFKNIFGPYSDDYEMQNLIKTFLDYNMNISKTASVVFMHRNTVMNKIDRFKEVTGFDIKNFKTAFVIYHLLLNRQ